VTGSRDLTASQRQWLRVRDHLRRQRHPLAVRAFADYDLAPPIGDAPLLVRPEWLPVEPVPLSDVQLAYEPETPIDGLTGRGSLASDVLPLRPDGSQYGSYSAVVADLAAPATFHNLPTYRLLSAELRGTPPRLVFGGGHYFDSLDTGEASAHEYAAANLGESTTHTLRTAIGDPTDLTRRPVNVAISALTLRHDRTSGETTMPLHRRDAAKVGHAGGMVQVIPVGVFQPVGPEPWNLTNDLSLWRGMLREYAEELLGAAEDYDTTTGPFDYDAWPFGARMNAAVNAGQVRAYVLGMGVDPLTFATDLLSVVVFDAGTYNELFADAVADNAEGAVLPAVPFTAEQVDHYAGHEPTQAAGAALLRLAWHHRNALLG
jgi:hypothetical protein